MASIDWDALIAAEEAQQAGGGGAAAATVLTAFEAEEIQEEAGDDDELVDSEAGDDDDDGDLWEDYEPDFQVGYAQQEQVGFGEGTVIGDRRLQAVQQRIESKETLYKNALKAELSNYFRPEDINSYANLIEQKVPKYHYKNPAALAAAIYMWRNVGNQPVTPQVLARFSNETIKNATDLYRYLRLLNLYL